MWRQDRTTIEPSKAVYYNGYHDGNPYDAPPGTLGLNPSYLKNFEAMESFSARDKRLMNPCQHYQLERLIASDTLAGSDTWYQPSDHSQGRWSVDPIPIQAAWSGDRFGVSGSPYSYYGQLWDLLKDLPAMFIDQPTQRFVTVPYLIKPYVDLSLRSMLPGIKPRLSLLNTLFELKDVKTLPGTLKSLKALARIIPSGITLRNFLRHTANVYLQQQFNINSLVGDVFGLAQATHQIAQELKRLQDNSYRRLRTHFRVPLTDKWATHDETHSQALPSWSVPSELISRRQVSYPVAMFSATMEYSYTVPMAFSEGLLVKALLDSVGVNLNPAIIWNAIPWSFLVDWFIGVSRWLDQFKQRNIEPITHIYQYCWSQNVERKVILSTGFGKAVPFGWVREKSYVRTLHNDPDQIRASITSSGLNLKEFSLGSALVLGR